jgi:hypothetical protein
VQNISGYRKLNVSNMKRKKKSVCKDLCSFGFLTKNVTVSTSKMIPVHGIKFIKKNTSITVAITYITKAEIITKTAGMIAAITKSNL